ncbi:MATE family efflux transporter [Candidatus Neomarinimicrobiota bacterium]
MKIAHARGDTRLNEFLANPTKALWKLSLPVMGGMVLHTLYSVVDMLFVGWVGPDAIAALSFNMPLVFFAFGITMGLSTGVTALIARAIGAENKKLADNTAEHALVLGLVLGIPMATVGLLWGAQILEVMGAKGNVNTLAWSYFRIISVGLLFTVLSAFFRGILVGEGDTVRPMIVMGSGMLVNIILDPIFIFWLDMGVAGAAYATVISQAGVLAVFVYLILHQETTYVRFRWRYFRYSNAILLAIFRIGLPASLSFVVMATGSAVFNKILSTFSFHAVAAYQIAGRFEMIAFMPVISIATGCVTLVGMFFGAKEYNKLRAVVKYTLIRASLIGLGAALIIFPFAPNLVSIFKPSPEILQHAVSYLRVNAFAFALMPLGMIAGRVMQGLGKGAPMLVITFLRVGAIGAPLAAYFVLVLDKPVIWVWYSMLVSMVVGATVGITWLSYTLRNLENLPSLDRQEATPVVVDVDLLTDPVR